MGTVIHSGRTLTPLSHFMDPGAPEGERCVPFWKNFDPSRTVRTQELQSVSVVIHAGGILTPLSHFMDPGAPECDCCDPFWKNFDPSRTVRTQAPECERCDPFLKNFDSPLKLYGPRSSRV